MFNQSSSSQSNPTIDLDKLLNLNPALTTGAVASHSNVELPNADRMCIVGILVDDSGSMVSLHRAVIDGLKLAEVAFKGAKGSDFWVRVQGFKQTYFEGQLSDMAEESFDAYYPDLQSTPLVTHSISMAKQLIAKAEEYQEIGIPTTVALLLMTDGMPYLESLDPQNFQQFVGRLNYVVGMGFQKRGESEADDSVSGYQHLFGRMGIKNIITPSATEAEVRHSINQFSQSVASIASS